MRERDIFVLVPNAARSALLVTGTELPRVRSSSGAAAISDALHRTFALEAPYLRPARVIPGAPSGPPGPALHEFDAPDEKWQPPPGMDWLPLAEADSTALGPPELEPYVVGWLRIARGAPTPEARPPWARPGWLVEASGWMESSLIGAGLEPVGRAEVVEQWPLSSVLRHATNAGNAYMKAVFSLFHHEPAVTQMLAREQAELVPAVLAVDASRGWMLMRELPGTQVGELEIERWADALPVVARIHRHWHARTNELTAFGAHERTLAMLASEIRAAFERAGLEGNERVVLELERRCEKLEAAALPETLVHGDFHPWNVMVDEDGARIFDWSDACISHPLFDLPTYLQRTEDERAREAMLQTYLGEWTDLGSPHELRAVYELALPLAYVHHAVSYQRISEALEPDDRWWFADVPRGFLETAVELLEAA